VYVPGESPVTTYEAEYEGAGIFVVQVPVVVDPNVPGVIPHASCAALATPENNKAATAQTVL
jgi:hypothetical protein